MAAPRDTGARRRPATDSATGAAGQALAVDPSTAVRFEIVGVDDSTFAFLAPRAPWLRAGAVGLAVDPRRRDLLVARFQVVALRGDTATALITGQTTRVVTDHVALVPRPAEQPPVPVVRRIRSRFWTGAFFGGIAGFIAGMLAR